MKLDDFLASYRSKSPAPLDVVDAHTDLLNGYRQDLGLRLICLLVACTLALLLTGWAAKAMIVVAVLMGLGAICSAADLSAARSAIVGLLYYQRDWDRWSEQSAERSSDG